MRGLARRSALPAAVAVVALVAIVAALMSTPPLPLPGTRFSRGANAAWLGVEWVNEPHTPAEVAALATQLADLEIRHIYVFTTYMKTNGEFNPTWGYAEQFIEQIRSSEVGPIGAVEIQAWVGLPLRSRPRGRGYVDLSDSATRAKIATLCAELVTDKGFDGVHLDPEPVSSGDSYLITLLEEIRSCIGSEAALSIASPRAIPVHGDAALPLLRRLGWGVSYYRQIAAHVDQIAVMTYDSTLVVPAFYQLWVAAQTRLVSEAIQGMTTELLVGIPTSEERTWTHHPYAENMASGLRGLIGALGAGYTSASGVTGVAIYPYWETSADEWATYRSLWLGR